MTAEPSAVDIVAGYQFVTLPDAAALRERLHDVADKARLKGTVLIAQEGINFGLAGEPTALQRWLATLQQDTRFDRLELKRHSADATPYRRLRVKLKREIIRMNEKGVQPQSRRAPAVSAPELARWLAQGHCDDGRPLALLDTRNGFEVQAGAFDGAIDWQLQRFSDFPAAATAHAADLQGKTVVSYCTGGIRCEKAALWLQQVGVEHVRQLDGGILRYFEQAPGAPGWQGRCFVFDERGALNAQLGVAST